MKVPRWIYRFRGVLVSPPLIFALVWSRFETENDYFIWGIGILIYSIGLALRIWAQQHLHYRLEVRTQLTTSGPYQFVRNPIYIGNVVICLALTILSELVWLAPIAFLWCATVYSLVIRHEEAGLVKGYGLPYRKYMSKVPRWLPYDLYFMNLGLINEHFFSSIVAEIHCLLFLLPYLLKEVF
jgi:protein-S-isoprenylcysteine O-methyltransferase Ste14